MKTILNKIKGNKLAWFVLATGIITLFNRDNVIGVSLISISISLFDFDDEETEIKK